MGVIDYRELPAVGQTGDPHMEGEATASKRMEPLLNLRFRRTCTKGRVSYQHHYSRNDGRIPVLVFNAQQDAK